MPASWVWAALRRGRRMGEAGMKRFIAYDTAVSTSLDLSAYLTIGDSARNSLEVVEGVDARSDFRSSTRLDLTTSHGRKLSISTDLELAQSVPGQYWRFDVEKVAKFSWVGSSGTVVCERLAHGSDDLMAFWLIHIFLPLYFTLEGLYEIIHACAVEVDGKTILFTGPSHAGKSTLTDYFLKQGHVLVSDDKVATYCEDEVFFAVPSHPNNRPYRKFEDLGLRTDRFSPRSRPIDGIYALQAADPSCDVRIDEVRGHRKFAQLMPNYMFDFGYRHGERLDYLARMMVAVPVYRVWMPWGLDRLGEIHSAILDHVGKWRATPKNVSFEK